MMLMRIGVGDHSGGGDHGGGGDCQMEDQF